jgi:hypothetical protein
MDTHHLLNVHKRESVSDPIVIQIDNSPSSQKARQNREIMGSLES